MGRTGQVVQLQLFLFVLNYRYQSGLQVVVEVLIWVIVVFVAILKEMFPKWAFRLNNHSHVQLFPVIN
jgi:hypothetical protein